MRIDETVVYVNQRLKEGYSIAKVERELEYGKDTLRKKLNRANYFYDKVKNQFLIDNTSTTHIDKTIPYGSITHPETQSLTQHNPSNNKDSKIVQSRAFTDEDFNILFKMIDEYKSRIKVMKKTIEISKDNSDLTTRSFRSYKSIFESFSKYCKENNLQQKDAVAEALLTFMKK